MSNEKKEGIISKFERRFINFEAIFLAGEGIIDLVICFIVMKFLINNVLLYSINLNLQLKGIGFLGLCIGIILVPIYYCQKWLRRSLLDMENKK